MTQPIENSDELEMILVKIAHEYAPKLVPSHWQKPGDLRIPLYTLARHLADYHVFTLIGFRGEHYSQDIPSIVRECADTYLELYTLLIEVLYRPLKEHKALYYSYSREKLLRYCWLEARPVAQVFAGCISPYVVQRQATSAVADVEIRALLSLALQQLDADDLTPAETQYIMTKGVRIIKHLLGMPLRQKPLTHFDIPFFTMIEPPAPPNLPESGEGPFLSSNDNWGSQNGEQPDFLRSLYDTPREPAPQSRPQTQPLRPQENAQQPPHPQHEDNLSGETGLQPPVDHPDDVPRPNAPAPARRTGGLRSPLPYWREDRNGDS